MTSPGNDDVIGWDFLAHKLRLRRSIPILVGERPR
jgi:hypothetical protein